MRRMTVAVLLGLAASVVAAPAVAEEPGLTWGACPDDVNAETVPLVLECTTVPVPLDHRAPDGERIDIMISRLASTDADARRGVLMLNPGGPGGSGLSFPALLSSLGMPDSVLDSYDVIGMDTRGIGHSAPVSCGFTDDQEYRANIPPYAVDDADVVAQAEIARGVAEQCAANDTGGRLPHLTTANMARDLDLIRIALGEEKTNFLGYSYGSALGAAYASMFPERSDRIVLDSNVGDTHLDRAGLRRFALGMEQTFPDFAAWAADRHGSYGLGRTPAEVRRTYFTLAERLDTAPVDGIDGKLFRMATFGSLYAKSRYAPLAQAWQSVNQGDGAPMAEVAAEVTVAAAPSPNDNFFSVFLAVTCNDVEWSTNVADYRRAVAEDRERFPMFGAAAANVVPCAFWPYEQAEPPVPVNADGPENVLVMQHQRDPATPLRGGELIDERFGDRSRLVSVDASGHGVYVIGDNPCALNVTTKYLVAGEFPKRDTTCR